MDGFSLPGYDVEQLLGFGGSGEVWRAREQASGQSVALKRLRGTASAGAGARPTAIQRLHREAALLATVRHEHVVRLRSVVPTDDGLVLVLDLADGGSLASVLGVRGRLSAGEVVTVGVPLAQALSEVHARGLTHGDVTPANIVFDASGKPMLADLGVARLAGEDSPTTAATPGFADPAVVAGGQVTPASDVHGLAAVCYAALAGTAPYQRSASPASLVALVPGAPTALVSAIESALAPDPRARPDAAGFARALYSSCAPEAVRLVKAPATPTLSEPTHVVSHRPAPRPVGSVAAGAAGAAVGPPVGVGRHRPRRMRRPVLTRPILLAVLAVGLLAGAVLIGVGWAAHDRSAAASGEPAPSRPLPTASLSAAGDAAAGDAASDIAAVAGDQEWVHVMTALDKARDQAFADAKPDELTGVYLPGSPALAADRETLAELMTAGERARDLGLRLTSVVVRSKTATSVILEVADTLPDYDLVRVDGTVQHQVGRGERAWVVTLSTTAVSGPWRIASISSG